MTLGVELCFETLLCHFPDLRLDHQPDLVLGDPVTKPVGTVRKTRQDTPPIPKVDTFTVGPCRVEARTDGVSDTVAP